MAYFMRDVPTIPGFHFGSLEPYEFYDLPAEAYPATIQQVNRMRLRDYNPGDGWPNVVSSRFQALVEELEPGVHQFIPVSVLAKDGTPLDREFFFFQNLGLERGGRCIVLSWRSGFDGTWETTIHGDPLRGLREIWGLTEETRDKLFLSKPELAGRHLAGNLWHGPSMEVVSDEFFRQLKSDKIDMKYMSFYGPYTELDEEWDIRKEIGPLLDWMEKHTKDKSVRETSAKKFFIRTYEYYQGRLQARS